MGCSLPVVDQNHAIDGCIPLVQAMACRSPGRVWGQQLAGLLGELQWCMAGVASCHLETVLGCNEATRSLLMVVCFVVSRGLEVAGYALCRIRPCICVAKVEIRGWLCNFCVADFNSDTGAGGHVSSTSHVTLIFGDCCCIEGTNRAFRFYLRSKSSIPVRLCSV